MAINWFPGHMNKARRVIAEQMERSDMVIEVLDARLPRSSQNPMLARIRRGKPCLQLLTKPDLADPDVTALWIRALSSPRVRPMEIVATAPGVAKKVVQACRDLVPERGHPGFPVRVMIVGIPNVGKSTLFNALVGKRKAEVRNQPAVTRATQQIELPGGVLLMDTPGVLWPKFTNTAGAYRLAASGAIRDSVVDSVDIARYLVRFLAEYYPKEFAARFRLDDVSDPNPDAVLEQAAQRRGCLTKGIGADLLKVSELLIHELRAGAIGRVSLESPADARGYVPDQTPAVPPDLPPPDSTAAVRGEGAAKRPKKSATKRRTRRD
jgi:ribosome biogenesis GTPase A